jgi:formate dehydrogenase subunit gamma
MVAAFYLFCVQFWRDNYMQQRDWIWLRKFNDVVTNREENLPDVGRYNAGQKLLFFTLVVCLIGLLLSGIVIWRVYFSGFFSIGVIRVAALSHAFFAFVLIFAIIVHIYAGIWVKGSIRAMTRGWVTPGWAWKHHRAWFREVSKGVQSK